MRILLVDDDKPLMKTLAERLVEEHYVVDIASTGKAAFDYLSVLAYDLVVLDVMLPDIDGISLCQQLRAQGSDLLILLLTAQKSREGMIKGLNAGADDYVVKPFDFKELTARIRALLRRERHALLPILSWGALRLDTNTCEASYAQQPLKLTPKEYELLELFLRNPTRVYSSDAIIENLWSLADPPSEEAVRTHIKGVRQKLKRANAPHDLITTIYGLGYRLKPEEAKSTAAVSPQPESPTLTAVAKVWDTFKGAMVERVSTLEQAAQTLAQRTLSSEEQQQAIAAAHKLAGSLGSFGFPQGSVLARELEAMLNAEISPHQAQRFSDLVASLYQELEHKPFETTCPTPNHPLLLIVSSDRAEAQKLATQAAKEEMRSVLALPTQAMGAIAKEPPAAVLFQLDHAHQEDNAASPSLEKLTELHQHTPNLPIVVITPEEDFTNRLDIVRRGARLLLTQPVPPAKAVQAVASVLRRSGAGAKVMIVDDDEQLLTLLQSSLAAWGFRVTLLDDPKRFWEVLKEVAPDLLVLDIEMPQYSGIELCQVLRSDSRWSHLPILFLTVHHDAKTEYQAFAIGADDYLTKPVMGAALANRIINRLERSHA